jgi:hypothetical protein
MKKYTLSTMAFAAVIASSISTGAPAADSKQSSSKSSQHETTMTKEQRQKMAEVHQKMADCLKSDKPLSECRSEMMKACHENMGGKGCPMMGHHMGEEHMHHGKSASSQGNAESETSDEHGQHH